MAKTKKVKIQLVRALPGVGAIGEVVLVDPVRAERWCGNGIAVLPKGASKVASDERRQAAVAEKRSAVERITSAREAVQESLNAAGTEQEKAAFQEQLDGLARELEATEAALAELLQEGQ